MLARVLLEVILAMLIGVLVLGEVLLVWLVFRMLYLIMKTPRSRWPNIRLFPSRESNR